MRLLLLLMAMMASGVDVAVPPQPTSTPLRSVLLITVDDLRPQLGCYGMNMTSTPNIDRLASGGVTFLRAYVQMAVCAPSRNSFMTGRRPDTTRCWNFNNNFRAAAINGHQWTSMPGYFVKHGFRTLSSGKLYHDGRPGQPPNNDYPFSWSKQVWGNGQPIGDADQCYKDPTKVALNIQTKYIQRDGPWHGDPMACSDLNDTAALNDNDDPSLPQTNPEQFVEYDHRLATRTIENLANAKRDAVHFFIAVGFRRPHLPFRVPQRFWDMYSHNNSNHDQTKLDVPSNGHFPPNVTELAFGMNGPLEQPYELQAAAPPPPTAAPIPIPGGSSRSSSRSRSSSSNNSTMQWRATTERGEAAGIKQLPDELVDVFRRAYYASVSFMDFEVGRVLSAVDSLGLAANTAVLFHADHGWKLGEHGSWTKSTNWELDVRSPLIIRAPWIEGSAGQKTLAIAELVDLFPTLVELANLPPVPAAEGLEGTSLVPILKAPNAEAGVKTAAFAQYPRCPQFDMLRQATNWECLDVPNKNISHMGYTVRTRDARYTEWRRWSRCKADWEDPSNLVASELYNHTGDTGLGRNAFESFENVNLVHLPSSQPAVATLSQLLRAQFENSVTQEC